MLPVEIAGIPNSREMTAACVPLPAPGAPNKISFIETPLLLEEALVLAHHHLRLQRADRLKCNTDNDDDRGTADGEAGARAAIQEGTPTGMKAKTYMDEGHLVPDEVIMVPDEVIIGIAEPDCAKGFILDGVPRTIAQAEALEAAGIKFDHVVSLEIADATIMERMSGRRVCRSAAQATTSWQCRPKPRASATSAAASWSPARMISPRR